MSRPTFFIGKYPIRACGITLYTFNKGKGYILLLKTKKWYEDIGGKTDTGDLNPFYTAAREANEESNRLLEFDEIYQAIQSSHIIVGRKSKYVTFGIEIPWFENTLIFGSQEEYEPTDRVFQWVDIHKLNRIKRSPRLDNYWLKKMKSIIKSKN